MQIGANASTLGVLLVNLHKGPLMRTKLRNQFNSYLKDDVAAFIRKEAVTRHKAVGEVIEDLAAMYRADDMQALLARLTAQIRTGPVSEAEAVALKLLVARL